MQKYQNARPFKGSAQVQFEKSSALVGDDNSPKKSMGHRALQMTTGKKVLGGSPEE
jgi:hypothetical protein